VSERRLATLTPLNSSTPRGAFRRPEIVRRDDNSRRKMQNVRGECPWTAPLKIYRLTARFPREERYGLTTQLRRSSSSIAANLAEGCGRNGDA